MMKQLDHNHPLTLIENSDQLLCPYCVHHLDESYCCNCDSIPYICSLCNKPLSGSCYTCKLCWESPMAHQSCFELPEEIQITYYRPHCLLHFEKESSGSRKLDCGFCNLEHIYYKYRCEDCGFQIGIGCASELIKWHEGQQHVEHFCHRHPLTLLKFDDMICMLCYENIDGPSYSYGCAPCKFYIHDSCRTKFLPQIQHNFHPQHSLTLQDYFLIGRANYQCSACRLDMKGLGYRCDKCYCDFHPKCILKPKIKYKGHRHLLVLIENVSYVSTCQACDFGIEGVFFMRCVECDLDFHVQCDSQPPPTVWLKEHKHPFIPIIEKLGNDDSHILYCNVCEEKINHENPFYSCVECECFVHLRCSFTDIQYDDKGRLTHFSHEHLLFLLENKRDDDNIFCVACEKNIQAGPAYGCNQCQFYLHKSCVDLPREISHPFHRHPLSLPHPYSEESQECNACRKHHYGFSYSCQACDFNLDIDCSLLFPSVKLQSFHEHNLTFFKKIYDTTDCDCESGCIIGRNKSIPLDDYYLRCVTCNFSLHLLCCPLPITFKHDCHHHSLTLKDNFIDLFVDDFDDEEFCCDFCETRRDARECVYHCEECNFVVDLDCLFSEVIQFLEGKHKDVEFRTVSKKITKKVKGLTYNDILKSLTEEEQEIVEKMIKQGTLRDMFDEFKASNHLVIKRISEELFFEESLENMAREHVQGTGQLKHLEEDADAELVNVSDYKISPKFAPILKNLLEKHGDIVASYPLTQSLKTMLLTTLCGVMQQMREIEVKDFRSEFFVDWWFLLKLVERAGFRIDFALDHIKRKTDEYFLIKDARSITSNPLYEVHKEMAQVSEEIDQRKARFENLKQQALDIVSSHGSDRSISLANRYNEALGSWWKNAAYPLLDDIPES